MSTFAQRAFAWRQNLMWHLIGPKGQETISQRQQLSANLERWINLGVPKEEIQIKDKSKTTYQLIRCKYDINNIYIYMLSSISTLPTRSNGAFSTAPEGFVRLQASEASAGSKFHHPNQKGVEPKMKCSQTDGCQLQTSSKCS